MQSQPINFATLAGGAVEERFHQELEKVLANIMDPNTDGKAVRGLNISIKFKPTEERRSMPTVEFQIAPKLAPVKNIKTAILIDEDLNGKVVSAELCTQVKGQMVIEGTETPDVTSDKVTKFNFQTAK